MCKLCLKQNAVIPMERRVRGNSHARCGVGENPEIASKDYLSLLPGAFSSGKPKYEDFRIVLEEIVRICFPNELIPGPYPYGWPDVGDLTAGDMFSIAWRCLDAQLCGVAQRASASFSLLTLPGRSRPSFYLMYLTKRKTAGRRSHRCTDSTRTGR